MAPSSTTVNVERLANDVVEYLCMRYPRNQHVRRVTSWLGLLLTAIGRVAGRSLSLSRTRQVTFEYRGHRFKGRFDHKAGPAGGIDILEVLPQRGEPDGKLVVRVTSLAKAEEVYRTLKEDLDAVIDG